MKKIIVLGLIVVTLTLIYFYIRLDRVYKTITIPFGKIDSSQVELIHIDLDKVTINLDSLVHEVNYIPLEEMEHSKIIRTEMVYMDSDRIIIVDQEGQKVVGFDHEGKYLFDIYKKGNGDQEYKYMEYAIYDYVKKEVLVIDTWKYIWYDLKGNYLRSYKSEYNFNDNIALLENSQLVYYRDLGNIDRSTNPASLNILDSTGQLVTRYQPIFLQHFNSQAAYVNGRLVSKADGRVLIKPNYSNEIFELDWSGDFSLKYRIDFGKHQLPKHYAETVLTNKDLTFKETNRFMMENNWATINSMNETESFLYINSFSPGQYYQIFFNKETGKTRMIESTEANELHGTPFYHITTHKDYFVSWVSPEDLRAAAKEGKISDTEVQKFIQNLDNGNNPVIRLVRIKDF